MNRDFVKVAETKDIQPTNMKTVEVAGEKICLANVEGKNYAIGNICTHRGGPLAIGFNTNNLGLGLVKLTVNQDDPTSYHLINCLGCRIKNRT